MCLYIYICMWMGCAQLWLTLCNPMDCSPLCTGSSVHGILQARIQQWVVNSSPADLPVRRQIHYHCTTWKVHIYMCLCIYTGYIIEGEDPDEIPEFLGTLYSLVPNLLTSSASTLGSTHTASFEGNPTFQPLLRYQVPLLFSLQSPLQGPQ